MYNVRNNKWNKGIQAAIASAVFLGLAPIFGKQALIYGFSPYAVVMLRSAIAAILLVAIMAVFKPSFFYIYPVGLVGCFLAGFINGLGSVLYYSALSRLDASIGQLLYSFYPLFVALWLMLDSQPINTITIIRLGIAIPGVVLLVLSGTTKVDLLGASLMLGAAILYALHLIINQRILFEVPAPTVTLYTLISMALTVMAAFFIFSRQIPPQTTPLWPILAMALITFLSRISLFFGVKHLGGMQTALLGLGELLVTVVMAILLFKERLSGWQWIGAGLIICSLVMVLYDRYAPEKRRTFGWLSWLNPPKITEIESPWKS